MKWFSLSIEDPLKVWRKAKWLFKKPRVKFKAVHFHNDSEFLEFESLCGASPASLVSVFLTGVAFKSKYKSFEFEETPKAGMSLFKRFALFIEWTYGEDYDYIVWEAIIDWLVSKRIKTIEEVIEDSTWTRLSSGEKSDCRKFLKTEDVS